MCACCPTVVEDRAGRCAWCCAPFGEHRVPLLCRSVSQAVIDSEALPKSLRTVAADAVDYGLSILYPTPKERKQLLTSLISKVRRCGDPAASLCVTVRRVCALWTPWPWLSDVRLRKCGGA